MDAARKNTSVFLEGDFSRKERKDRKAGGPTSVSATIDRSGWKRVRLGDFESHRNNTCARSLMTSDSGSVHNIHYGDILVKYDEVVSLLHHNVDCLTVEGETNSPKDYICDGDVIIADTAEDETVGKTVEIQDVGNSKVVAGLHTFLYRPPSNMFVRGWLGYWMNSSAYHSQLFQYMTGTKVLSLTRASIAATVIQYPSRELQQQIVTALDSIQTQINATQKLIAKYEAIKKATVNLLLKPKAGWQHVTLGEIFDLKVGGDLDEAHYSPRKTNDYRYEIVSNSLANCGLYGYTSLPKFPGDSLTITGRGNIGHAEYRKESFDAIVRIVVLTPINRNVCAKFVASLINATFPFQIESTGVPQLTAPQISATCISIPPVDEQKRIVAILDSIDGTINGLKSQLAKAQDIKQGMMSYFFG